jgi:hypothetical protein
VPNISISELRTLNDLIIDIEADVLGIEAREPRHVQVCGEIRRLLAAVRAILADVAGQPLT